MIKKILLAILAIILVGFIYLFFAESDEFKDSKSQVSNSPIGMFDKSAIIFEAITIYGTKDVPTDKLKHAAQVAAQWLDNNEDGIIDDVKLQTTLQKNKAIVVMSKNGFSMMAMAKIASKFSEYTLQDLYAKETNNPNRRDASQEEIHHIIINAGFQKTQPKVFSDKKDVQSKLYKIWKFANDNGYYSYDDPTCDDACKVTEFVYLATAAYLGSEADLFSDEMRLKNRIALKEKIPEIIEVFESKAYVYPTHKWPDGKYQFSENIQYLGVIN